jgi:tight adherence protein B
MLERHLPEALERVSSGMSAGYSLQQALAAAAGSPRQPLAGLLGMVLGRVRAGLSLEDALRHEASSFRRSSIRLALLTMASCIRSGTNIVESLHFLAKVCREREALRRKIDSLTAQSRLQGIILSLVPLFFMLALGLVSPIGLQHVVSDPLGRKLIAIAFTLEALGGWTIHRMIGKEVF